MRTPPNRSADHTERIGGDHAVDASRLQRRTIRVLVVMQIVGTVGVGIAPSIGILLAEVVTDSETWAGLARTTSTLGAALFGLPLGALAARFGRRHALASGWWTAAAGSALLVVAAQFNQVTLLFCGLLLIGSGSAVSLQARFAATDLAHPHHKARALALIVWVGTVGSVLGPNLGVPGEAVGDLLGVNVYAGGLPHRRGLSGARRCRRLRLATTGSLPGGDAECGRTRSGAES
ncbi:MFS transporter [Gordonia humi]|uniref:MFS transporter n=1 Tax=Gordonia humi TaxID=686429 RepID=UPI003609DBE1